MLFVNLILRVFYQPQDKLHCPLRQNLSWTAAIVKICVFTQTVTRVCGWMS